METGRLFAVIPAAGLSRRMGRPKLQLQLGGRSVLHHLLDRLVDARISDRLVVIRESDEPLRNLAQQIGVAPVLPSSDPPDSLTTEDASSACWKELEGAVPCWLVGYI